MALVHVNRPFFLVCVHGCELNHGNANAPCDVQEAFLREIDSEMQVRAARVEAALATKAAHDLDVVRLRAVRGLFQKKKSSGVLQRLNTCGWTTACVHAHTRSTRRCRQSWSASPTTTHTATARSRPTLRGTLRDRPAPTSASIATGSAHGRMHRAHAVPSRH